MVSLEGLFAVYTGYYDTNTFEMLEGDLPGP